MLSDGFDENVIIFGVDMSSSVHINNKKDIFILSKDPTQGLGNTTLIAKAAYLINFTEPRNKFSLSLYWHESCIYLFTKGVKICQFKAKDTEITAYTLCLRNISKTFSVNDMKETGLNVYVHDYSFDFSSIDVAANRDIHKYLKKKNYIK